MVYPYLNEDGEYCESSFNIWIRRTKFRETSARAFQEKVLSLREDTSKLAEIIMPLIADWELFADEQCTTKCPLEADFLADRPQDFVELIGMNVLEVIQAQDPKKTRPSLENGSERTGKKASRATI